MSSDMRPFFNYYGGLFRSHIPWTTYLDFAVYEIRKVEVYLWLAAAFLVSSYAFWDYYCSRIFIREISDHLTSPPEAWEVTEEGDYVVAFSRRGDWCARRRGRAGKWRRVGKRKYVVS